MSINSNQSDNINKLGMNNNKNKLAKELSPCGTATMNPRLADNRIPVQIDQRNETYIGWSFIIPSLRSRSWVHIKRIIHIELMFIVGQ